VGNFIRHALARARGPSHLVLGTPRGARDDGSTYCSLRDGPVARGARTCQDGPAAAIPRRSSGGSGSRAAGGEADVERGVT
jgi:hypothetical protein